MTSLPDTTSNDPLAAGSARHTARWQLELSQAVRSGSELLSRLNLSPHDLPELLPTADATDFPVLVPVSFLNRMQVGNPCDPLLLQVLHSQGAQRQSALSSLRQQLGRTYAPAIERELIDLLEAATGLGASPPAASPVAASPPRSAPATPAPAPPALQELAPGMALAASGALVLCWAGGTLDRQLLEGWGWSGGVVLVLVLGLLQALAIGPLRGLRRRWSLNERQAIQPRHAWRWIGASWIHVHGLEASLNLLLLLILLGASPLPLGQVILRYGLTALACLTPAVVLAQRFGVRRRWSGAAGPISALIALAAGLSLLHWRAMAFDTPLFQIPPGPLHPHLLRLQRR